MRNSLASVTVCAGLVMAGLAGGGETRAHAQGAPAGPAPVAPPDTAALRAQYEQWRTEFKTWGRWAPLGQESRGTQAQSPFHRFSADLGLICCRVAPRDCR